MNLAQLVAQLPAAGPTQAVVELLLGGGIGGQLTVEQLTQLPIGGRQGGRGAQQLLLNQVQAFEGGAHGFRQLRR